MQLCRTYGALSLTQSNPALPGWATIVSRPAALQLSGFTCGYVNRPNHPSWRLDLIGQVHQESREITAATLPLGYAGRHCSRNGACANLQAESACAPHLKKHRRKSRKSWASPYATWALSWKGRRWTALCSS